MVIALLNFNCKNVALVFILTDMVFFGISGVESIIKGNWIAGLCLRFFEFLCIRCLIAINLLNTSCNTFFFSCFFFLSFSISEIFWFNSTGSHFFSQETVLTSLSSTPAAISTLIAS